MDLKKGEVNVQEEILGKQIMTTKLLMIRSKRELGQNGSQVCMAIYAVRQKKYRKWLFLYRWEKRVGVLLSRDDKSKLQRGIRKFPQWKKTLDLQPYHL